MATNYIVYYNTQSNAAAAPAPPSTGTGYLGVSTSTVTNFPVYEVKSGYSVWITEQSNFSGLNPIGQTKSAGQTLDAINGVSSTYVIVYPSPNQPPIPCFLEGSTLTCLVGGEDKEVPIEKIRKGTLVKTLKDGYKKVELIGSRPVENPGHSERTQNRLYKLSKEKYPELKEDLYLTGCHSILVDSLTNEEREETIKQLEVICVTDKKYRLMANIDKRAEPWTSAGEYTVWHLALECSDDGLNFGVYANGGLLVETCSIRYLKNKSKMTFH
jgi:hypothetical protein